MDSEIVVSIVCNAYNQEKYIAQALESFLMQETEFSFEVLVHDDASTDGTAEIIRQYALKYPGIVKPYFQTENQYSKHVPITRLYQYSRANGKYIAWCEGDDYWTDPLKLQKQVEALEKHPEIDLCAHRAVTVLDGKPGTFFPKKKEDTVFSVEEVIAGGGGFVATNSLMCRRVMLGGENDYTQVFNLDYILQISGSLRGGMLYLSDCMAAYRRMTENSWSVRVQTNVVQMGKHVERLEDVLCQIDQATGYAYTQTIQKHMKESRLKQLARQGELRQVLSRENREAIRAMPFKLQIGIVLMAAFHSVKK